MKLPKSAEGPEKKDYWVALVLAIALLIAYVRTLAPDVLYGDSAEFQTLAYTLGVTHSTGYPTYLFLGRLIGLLPISTPAWRISLLSAFCAAITIGGVYLLARYFTHSRAGAILGGLALGISYTFWSQAVIAEVYSLNALFIALILLFMLQAIQHPLPAWATRSQAVIVGLALGNHATAMAAAIVWFVGVAICAPREQWVPLPALGFRLLVRRALWVGAGLLVYLYLPLRARAHPPVNWGDPHDWSGFWWTVSGQPYRELAFGLPSDLIYGRVAAWAALLVQQFG